VKIQRQAIIESVNDDVQVFDEDRLTFAWRCPRESNARFIAAGLRRDLLRNCWTKVGPARRQRV